MSVEAVAGWGESPADEYIRLGREVTMLQARMADRLARIDAEGWYEDAGYLSAAAFVRGGAGVSAGEASRRVAEARALRMHPEVRRAYAMAELDRPRVAMLLAAAKVSDEAFDRDQRVLVDTIRAVDDEFSSGGRLLEAGRRSKGSRRRCRTPASEAPAACF